MTNDQLFERWWIEIGAKSEALGMTRGKALAKSAFHAALSDECVRRADGVEGWEVKQPDPKPNNHPAIADLVKADIDARVAKGVKTYGTKLQPFNGRDPLLDLYEELLDAAKYARQELCERYGK